MCVSVAILGFFMFGMEGRERRELNTEFWGWVADLVMRALVAWLWVCVPLMDMVAVALFM